MCATEYNPKKENQNTRMLTENAKVVKTKDTTLLFLHPPKVQFCEKTISQRFILLDYWSKLIFKAIILYIYIYIFIKFAMLLNSVNI